MIVDKQVLGQLDRSFRSIFMANLTDPAKLEAVRAAAMTVPSTGRDNQYNWATRQGGLREWVGERVINRLKAYGFTIANKLWEDAVSVARIDIEDDQLGQYGPEIQSMANDTNQHYVKLICELFGNGFTNTCYDGQFFFDTDHPVGDPGTEQGQLTVSNKGTAALSEAALKTAFNNLNNLRNDRNEPLGIRYDTLFIHPSQAILANKLLNAEHYIKPAGSSMDYNEIKGLLRRVVELPYLANANHWFLADTSRPVKGMILQLRTRPQWQSVTSDTDSEVFKKDHFYYGVRARHNAGYALWQLMYGSDGSA